jgi:hypothetical protein
MVGETEHASHTEIRTLPKERWAPTGPFGRVFLPIDDALQFIAHEDIFWVMT